ncbi:MAG: dynamin family protein [Syntrophobacteraceae bacterium]
MNRHMEFKKKIQYRAEILEETIEALQSSGLLGESAAPKWRSYLRGAYESLKDPLLKIAIVGSVKSGKSTLINSMIGGDLLRRGAGIITAFITRVVTGEEKGGWVDLKSWAQINSEVNTGLRMLPVFTGAESEEEEFDLRNSEDRSRIAFLIEKMKTEWLQSHGSIDPYFMFLERSLQGFSLVGEEIGDEVNRISLGEKEIPGHQLYAGEECRSVYVRDIEIHHPVSWLGEHIELADCQGSDSPNPTHFELLQQYLLSSHFILYVIGSRTGLREADFKLLDLIKSLKMFPQTLFVLNLDFDILAGENERREITERVRSELGWVVPTPHLFAFSALFQLLKELGDKAPKFERRRFKMWKDAKAVKGAEAGWNLFRKELEERICTQRSKVLLGCGLSRLAMIAANINDTARMRQSALETNIAGVQDREEKLRSRHLALQSTLQNLSDTVSGLNRSIKSDLDTIIDRCFDPSRGGIVREALDLVEHYPISMDDRKAISDYARFVREYYSFYVDFRRSLSRHLIEKINLRIVEFTREEEFQLTERIRKSSEALWSFFDAALADYRSEINGTAPEANMNPEGNVFSSFAQSAGINPPCFSLFLQRNSLARGILFLKFGLTSFPGILSGIKSQMRRLKKTEQDEKPAEDLFLRARETARSEAKAELLRAFGDFRESLRSDFFYRLADEGCILLLEEFRTRAEMAQVDFSNLLQQDSMEGTQRLAAMEALTHARQITSAMLQEIEVLRREAGNLPGPASPTPGEPAPQG